MRVARRKPFGVVDSQIDAAKVAVGKRPDQPPVMIDDQRQTKLLRVHFDHQLVKTGFGRHDGQVVARMHQVRGPQQKPLAERALWMRLGEVLAGEAARAILHRCWKRQRPAAAILSRSAGPHIETIIEVAREFNTPIIVHIDDDLLELPTIIGLPKWRHHNKPERRASRKYALDHADIV